MLTGYVTLLLRIIECFVKESFPMWSRSEVLLIYE